jgi:hypothetical protein
MNPAQMRDAFIVQVAANLVTAAILYLIANGAGLIAQNTAGAAIAFLVVTWAVYGGLLQREMLKPKPFTPSPALLVVAVLVLVALVLEVAALRRSNDWGPTIGITVVSVFVATIPAAVINLAFVPRARTKSVAAHTTR